jgi:uncharacterized protein (TIGR00266 family)
MEFKIENSPVFSILKIIFQQGEAFKVEAGAMVSMSPTLELEAKTTGKGLFGAIAATMGGESLFSSLFTAKTGPGELVLAPSTLGDIVKIQMSGQTILAQSGAYLAGSPELVIATQGSFKAMVSGEGLFLSKITGNGVLFLNSYGAIYEKTLAPGEKFIIDCGHIIAFESTVTYQIKKAAKGIFGSIASGEGLVSEYSGTGKIWYQTRNLPAFARIISKFIPKSSS